MVLVQTVVVVQRYVFGISWIWLQESVMYMYGLLFLLAAGYTLLHDGHVRVDIFYRAAKEKTKALIDFLGTYLFLFPVMYVILDLGYPYFEISWRVKETSPETSGIPGIFVLKFAILMFAGLMTVQGLSLNIRAAFILIGEAPQTPEQRITRQRCRPSLNKDTSSQT
jgi:TRAP-type mannitol/chloroaromatic compound transport system permease small subunit